MSALPQSKRQPPETTARTGAGVAELERQIARRARPETDRLRLRIPYRDGRAIAGVRARWRILAEEDRGEFLLMTVAADRDLLGGLRAYLVEEPGGEAAAAGR